MTDRSEDLRREAARCFEPAERSKDPNSRNRLVRLGNTFSELADSVKGDFGTILRALTAEVMQQPSEPAAQQQQQVQPKREDE
jgi:hypothetical protein